MARWVPQWLPDLDSRFGMLVVETIAKSRRAYFVRQRSIEAICRELSVSRKVVRSGASSFHYERSRQPRPKLGPLQDELDRLLTITSSSNSAALSVS
jgi:hypothetical protein